MSRDDLLICRDRNHEGTAMIARHKKYCFFIFLWIIFTYIFLFWLNTENWLEEGKTVTNTRSGYSKQMIKSLLSGSKKYIQDMLVSSNLRMDSEMDKMHFQRRKILLEACERNKFQNIGNTTEKSIKDHFVVDRKNHIVYCAMEKIGSTFWRRLFQITSGMSKSASPFQIHPGNALGGGVETFSKLFFDDIHSILTSSSKFVFTRDPFERLLSGYVDKLFSPNLAYWSLIGRYAIKLVRKNSSVLSLECGQDLTFPEFVKYFIHSQKNNEHRNGHFIPMYDHCRPCQMKYNIIGKMETFEEDTLYILEKFNFTTLHDTLKNEFQNQTRQDSFRDQTNLVFSFPTDRDVCLNAFDRQRRLWKKMQIRGMISKHSKYPYGRDDSKSVTKENYINALNKAVKGTRDKMISKKYRQEAFIEAYSKVPEADLRELQQVFEPDCQIFGYDCDIQKFLSASSWKLKNWAFYFDIDKA